MADDVTTGGLTELKALLKDNYEASSMLGNIEKTVQTSVDRVVDLEKQLTASGSKLDEAIVSRDKVRDIVKNELGVEEFTTDAVRNRLSSFASDDVIAARDKQFNDLRASSGNKIEGLEKAIMDKDATIKEYMMKLAISKTDIMGQTKGEHANDMLLSWISENAQFDDNGEIIYRGPSGESLYNTNNDPLTLDDRINEIKADSTRDFVFQSRFLKGSGAPTSSPETGPAGNPSNGTKYIRSKMTFDEQRSYRLKYGESAYAQLPLV